MTDKVAEARYSVSDVVAVAIYSVLGSPAHACLGVCSGVGPANDQRSAEE